MADGESEMVNKRGMRIWRWDTVMRYPDGTVRVVENWWMRMFCLNHSKLKECLAKISIDNHGDNAVVGTCVYRIPMKYSVDPKDVPCNNKKCPFYSVM